MSDRRQHAKRIDRSQVDRPELCNMESEQILLGAIILNNDVYWTVADAVKESDFFEPLHRTIFRNCADLVRSGRTAAPVTLLDFMDKEAMVGETNLSTYIAGMLGKAIEEVVTAAGARSYGQSVSDMATRRVCASVGEGLIADLYGMQAEDDPRRVVERHIQHLQDAITPNIETFGAVSFGEALTSAIDMANVAYMADGEKGGAVHYDVPPLHRLIGPLHGGQLIILGGATKQGKSALAGQIAMGAAKAGTHVDFYSGEMTPEELAMREIARQTGINVADQKQGGLTEPQFTAMIAVQRALKDVPILIQDKRMTLPQLKERWGRVVRKRGPSLLICDHVGLLDRDKETTRMDVWQFGEHVTRELKATARNLACPIIACVQLKKNTFANDGKQPLEKLWDTIIRRRPRYADLTGGVEKDADHVIIPFRPDVLLAEHEPAEGTELHAKWAEKVGTWQGRAQLVLALSRERKWPKSVTVGWDGPATSFFDLGSDRGEPAFAPVSPQRDPFELL